MLLQPPLPPNSNIINLLYSEMTASTFSQEKGGSYSTINTTQQTVFCLPPMATLLFLETSLEERAIAFFKQEHRLFPIIQEIKERIQLFFENYYLEETLHTDPEESWTKLFLIIHTNTGTNTSFQIMRRFFKNWKLAASPQFYNYINVSTDFL